MRSYACYGMNQDILAMRRIVETDSIGSVVKPRFTKAAGGGEDRVAARLDPSIGARPLNVGTLY